jgi:hypothetical protein
MNVAEPGTLADGAHPPVRGAPVEALPVPVAKDRAFMAFAHGQVDRAGGSWDERDGRWLVALPGVGRSSRRLIGLGGQRDLPVR